MTTNAVQSKEKTKNYSTEQEKILRDRSPFGLDVAKELAESADFTDKSYQSIISKVKNMGLEYIPKPAPRKKAVQATKEDLVQIIQSRLDRDLSGLEKSTRGALLLLINGLDHAIPKVEPELPEIGDNAK